jgi:hypothetical protein
MSASPHRELIDRKYREAFGARLNPSFSDWMAQGEGSALGYRRAGPDPLFLEAYLDQPVEMLVSKALGQIVDRDAIVEIGNFAADNALAMIELWGSAANDLGGSSEVAVATLTAPLRSMFARIGLPILPLAPADPARLGGAAGEWGSYYASDPMVCMGVIAEGQAAIGRFLSRRKRRLAA